MKNLEQTQDNIIVGEFRPSLLASLVVRVKKWYQQRQAIRQLSAMPDHLLHDIGIERYQIPNFVVTSRTHNEVIFRPSPVETAVEGLPKAA